MAFFVLYSLSGKANVLNDTYNPRPFICSPCQLFFQTYQYMYDTHVHHTYLHNSSVPSCYIFTIVLKYELMPYTALAYSYSVGFYDMNQC